MKKQLKAIIKKCKHFLSEKLIRYDKKLPYIITSIITLTIVIGCIKLFFELTEQLKTEVLVRFDTMVTQYISSFKTPVLDRYFLFVTHMGDALGYVIVFLICTLLFYLILKNWKYVAQLTLILILALCSNLLLKHTINRARPLTEHLVVVKTLSYPSGHAMAAMAFYGFLIFLIYTFKIKIVFKFLIIVLLSVLILSIGISRVYLGVHFPSDIIGGFIGGFIWVVFCIFILNMLKVFKEDPET